MARGAKPWHTRLIAMHQLLLLRHAKSAQDDPALPDHARPLNARGRDAAAAMRTAMRGLGLAPDVVLVSSALRTRQTLAALEPWDDTPIVQPLDQLYLAPPERMLAVLRQVAETVRSVLVIGHNPGMHELALLLKNGHARGAHALALADGFPTAALAEFSVPGPWADIGPGRARLMRFLRPRDLPLHP